MTTWQLGPATVTPAPAGRFGYGRLSGAPVSADVSAPFGEWGDYRKRMGLGPHRGVDLAAAAGVPIAAPAPGRVVARGFDDSAGNYVIVEIAGGLRYHCYHLAAQAFVAAAETVHAGEVLGHVGATGDATGPHLHFGLQLPTGMFLDPLPYFVPTFADAQAASPEATPSSHEPAPADGLVTLADVARIEQAVVAMHAGASIPEGVEVGYQGMDERGRRVITAHVPA